MKEWGAVDSSDQLWRVTAPHFCAGIVTEINGFVRNAPPILKWAIGKDISWLKTYCRTRRWKLELVDEPF